MAASLTAHFDDRFPQVRALFAEKAKAGLRSAGEGLLANANADIPYLTGQMESSGAVTEGDNEVVVSYDTVYAPRQHEEMSYQHPQGRAKWLELALQENVSEIIAEMELALGGGL